MNTAYNIEANCRRGIAICGMCMFVIISSCGKGKHSDTIAANVEALENLIDLSDHGIDADEYLRFDKPSVTLGDIPFGETRTVKVRAKNTGDNPLAILDVATSCGCTKAKWSAEPIRTNEYTEIEVSFTADTEGVFFKKIAVTHSTSPRPVSFTIEGAVTPYKR